MERHLGPRLHLFPRDPGKDAVQGPEKTVRGTSLGLPYLLTYELTLGILEQFADKDITSEDRFF